MPYPPNPTESPTGDMRFHHLFGSSTSSIPQMTPPGSPISDLPPAPPLPISKRCMDSPRPKLSRHQYRESVSSCLSGGFRTLIVDDNPINVNILERTLKRHFTHLVSPDIAIAFSGNAALSQVSPQPTTPQDEKSRSFTCPPTPIHEGTENPFDLILLDVDMPDISGIEVAEQIRNIHNDQVTAIVAVTMSTKPEQQKKYEQVGIDGVVGKPIDLSVLDRVVTRALLSRRGRALARTSSDPPLPRGIIAQAIAEHTLLDISPISTLSASSLDISTLSPQSLESPASRRGSFQLSLEELEQLQETASFETNDDSNNLEDRISKASFFEDVPTAIVYD